MPHGDRVRRIFYMLGTLDEKSTKIGDDHVLKSDTYDVPVQTNGSLGVEHVPALNALNERLRDDYIVDCQKGVDRWNKGLERAGVSFRLALPHKCFHRRVGHFDYEAVDAVNIDPAGNVISEADWTHKHTSWLPTTDDHAYVASLMQKVDEPGKMANWIAAPRVGINNQPLDFEYVRFH